MRGFLRSSVALILPWLAAPKNVARPEPKQAPGAVSEPARKVRGKGHSITAESYELHRDFAPGRSSTVKKTAKLYRLRGAAPTLPAAARERHVHPRHQRVPS